MLGFRRTERRLYVKRGSGTVILRGAAGVGLCTRPGLDCEQGKWAINTGPRRMIAENLHHAGLDAGCWLLEIGVENGEELAKHTLNPLLGVVGGISILGTTGLVRPYSHEAYIETVRICVKSHHIAHGTTMVFCTGGRTKSGAERRLPSLPETAFTCIGDFIAESLAAACEYGMREIVVACMAGKLCKYAAGFENTHAHKVSQDMDLLRAEVRKHLPGEEALHDALAHSVSVREALLSIPEADRPGILRRLARTALGQFARRCGENIALRLLVFDFEGQFLFEEKGKTGMSKGTGEKRKNFSGQSDPSHASASSPEAPTARSGEHAEPEYNGTIGLTYFWTAKGLKAMDGNEMDTEAGRIDVVSCGIGFRRTPNAGLIGRADVVYGSRALLAACPVEARLTGSSARKPVRMRRTPHPVPGRAACRGIGLGRCAVPWVRRYAFRHGPPR